jgi:hypothetical protein
MVALMTSGPRSFFYDHVIRQICLGSILSTCSCELLEAVVLGWDISAGVAAARKFLRMDL